MTCWWRRTGHLEWQCVHACGSRFVPSDVTSHADQRRNERNYIGHCHCVRPFYGSSFLVASSWRPRRHAARHARLVVTDILAMMSRGCYEENCFVEFKLYCAGVEKFSEIVEEQQPKIWQPKIICSLSQSWLARCRTDCIIFTDSCNLFCTGYVRHNTLRPPTPS